MNTTPAPDLSFVVITYNDAGRLPRCLSSCALMSARAGLEYEILVVDNGSADHTQAVLEEFAGVLGPRLHALRMERNTGTTYSRNRALELARGRHICVLDSDAELLQPDFAPLLGLLRDFPQVGLVGPAILLPGGDIYNSAKLLPTLSDKLLKLPQIFWSAAPRNHDWYPDFPFAGLRCVDTVISCCWFFRRELFQRLGPLDENIFYAPEDVDWCLRCWKAGLAVVYYPRFKVLHHTRQTSHKQPLSRTALSHLQGLIYYLRKHGYLFNRQPMRESYILPLARELDPRLAAWESAS